jgi:hypothetical protein
MGWIGRGDWGRRLFWENVPPKQQELDADKANVLELLLKTWGDEYEAHLQQVLTLPLQRDTFQARAAGDGGEDMYVVQTVAEVDATYGAVLKLLEPVDVADFATGVVPCTQAGAQWVAEVGDGRWPVVLVRLRNADATYDPVESLGNEVWCSTGAPLPFAHVDEEIGRGNATPAPPVATAIRARFAVNPGLLVVDAGVAVTFTSAMTGVTTAYDNGVGELREDVAGPAVGNLRATVDYDTGLITMDVDHDVMGDSVFLDSIIAATYTVQGYYIRLRPVSMLEWLHRDFGLTADTGAADDVQRAALAHYAYYMGQKGSAFSYDVLGSIYLFDVEATGLWEVCYFAQVADYPADHVFAVGGRTYTDIGPRKVRFDDIAADAEYYDHDGDHNGGMPGLVPLLDREVIYDDASLDTWSVAKAFAVDVTQGYYYPARVPATVVSATALTAAELVTYGLSVGFRVVVAMTQAQKDEFSYTGRGIWALTEYDKVGGVPPSWTADPYWIDAEDGWNAGLLQWTVVIGAAVAPTVGGDVAVRYWPTMDTTDCCYCRSNFVRLAIGTTAEGIAAYGHYRSVRPAVPLDPPPAPVSKMRAAQCRLEARLVELLMPSHVRILEIVDVP